MQANKEVNLNTACCDLIHINGDHCIEEIVPTGEDVCRAVAGAPASVGVSRELVGGVKRCWPDPAP